MTEHRHAPFLLIPAFFLLYCASQLPPPGGAVDSIPPVVIRTVPDSAAIRVTENRIELVFSEYVDRRSVEEAVFLSPPAGTMDFDWSGKEVTIQLAETLRNNKTYVLTVGTDVTDQRAKNRMADGFSLAFSTGDSLDQGVLSGRVYDKKPEGLLVFAYLLDSLNSDTLDPARKQPDYLMQTGNDGSFLLSNLAWGTYRVFAVRDEYRNLLYDSQLDQYGVYTSDVTIAPEQPIVYNIGFRVTKEDTTAPFLSSVQAPNDRLIRFRFSERVDSASFAGATFSLTDTLSGRRVESFLVYQSFPEMSAGVIVLSEPLEPSSVYQLTVAGVADSAGWLIDSSNASLDFEVSTVPDTISPGLAILSFADTLLGYPVGRPLQIIFNEPVAQSSAGAAFILADTGGQLITSKIRWLSPVRLVLDPEPDLSHSTLYQLTTVMDSIKDLQGNGYTDSTRSIRFTTYNPERAGELEGFVRESGGTGKIIVSAVRVSDQWRRDVALESAGAFAFLDLPEGRFFVEAYRDEDGSGSYSFGLPFPFRSSERFVVGLDTAKVRPRWSAEGLTIILP